MLRAVLQQLPHHTASVAKRREHEAQGVRSNLGAQACRSDRLHRKLGGGLEEKGETALGVIVYFLDSGVDCRNIRGIWGIRK